MGPKHNRAGKAPSGDREREQIRLLWALLEWVVQQLGFTGATAPGPGPAAPRAPTAPTPESAPSGRVPPLLRTPHQGAPPAAPPAAGAPAASRPRDPRQIPAPAAPQSTHNTHTRVRGTTWSTLADMARTKGGSTTHVREQLQGQ